MLRTLYESALVPTWHKKKNEMISCTYIQCFCIIIMIVNKKTMHMKTAIFVRDHAINTDTNQIVNRRFQISSEFTLKFARQEQKRNTK